jgi:hypothetical protein
MVEAHIEVLQPAVALSGPRPQGAEPITPSRRHDARDLRLGQLAPQAQVPRGRRKIDRRLKRLPG